MNKSIIATRPCGCVCAVDLDGENWMEYIRQGYSVRSASKDEAIEAFQTAKTNCGHGTVQEQLARKLGL